MIRLVSAVALAVTVVLPAEARALKLRMPFGQHVEKYVPPIGHGFGRSFGRQSDCGAAPKLPCPSPGLSPSPMTPH